MPAPRTSSRRRSERVVAVPPERFAAGWRLARPERALDGEVPGGGEVLPGAGPPIVVDVVRPSDLVCLTVAAYGCELVSGGDGPALRPIDGGPARLVVRLAFQHLAEAAIYEESAPVPNDKGGPPVVDDVETPRGSVDGERARPSPPIPARPAGASRLVFDVPAGERIGFSSDGILAAMSRLPLVVHDLARPGTTPTSPEAQAPVVELLGGLRGRLLAEGVRVTSARRATGMIEATATGLAMGARDLRRVRTALAATVGAVAGRAASEAVADLGGAGRAVIDVGGRRSGIGPLVGAGGITLRPGTATRPLRRATYSRPARSGESSIEAPFRLTVSPDAGAAWAHATQPVGAEGAEHRVELWHTRLGRAALDPAGKRTGEVDERTTSQRIVRALWTRDRERWADWRDLKVAEHDLEPFRTSLDGADRHMLVRQSAEAWLDDQGQPIPPVPVAARALWLSSLGAWIDLHGIWTTLAYSAAEMASIMSWDNVAPMGRDQYVRVVYPGYLYPCGHKAALVKLTERKMKDASPSVAALYQRKFLVIGEPVRTYDQLDLPLTQVRVRPEVTPTLSPDPGRVHDSFFWPKVDGRPFAFTLDCLDREGHPVRLSTPLLWVAEHYQGFPAVQSEYSGNPAHRVPALGQKVTFTRERKGGEATLTTEELELGGQALLGGARPALVTAKVRVPAVEAVSPVGAVTIAYAEGYKLNGFPADPDNPSGPNAGEVWAAVPGAPPTMAFGATGAGSDKAGGFVAPNLPIRGLSRSSGAIGDPIGMAAGTFDPKTFLGNSADLLPRLFGIVPLTDLITSGAPKVVSEALDRVTGLAADLERLVDAAADAVAESTRQVERVKDRARLNDLPAAAAAELAAVATSTLQSATGLEAAITPAATGMLGVLASLKGADQAAVDATFDGSATDPRTLVRSALDQVDTVGPLLTPLLAKQLAALSQAVRPVLAAADLMGDVVRFISGVDPTSVQAHFRFEWRPTLTDWSFGGGPFLQFPPGGKDALVLAVEGRADGTGKVGTEVLAELRDFTLNLLPVEPLVRIRFDRLSFHSGTSGKTDVDVVIKQIEFVGFLSFVETLRRLVPFDGFSDPPYLDVAPEGLSAGFSLALPNVAIGVFALTNISLGADVRVPFLGKSLTVGFNFCSRERPFTLQVTFIGGGGWFGIRISPEGLDVLELGLEAGATLSVNLGVASGSVSVMIGIYIRMEAKAGSLTGYFRIRGEVDVLGLVSASVELYLELRYEMNTGKMVGRASITVSVSVMGIGGSVKVECERRFAGSNGDPTFAQLMAAEDGTSAPWSEYCLAYAGA